MSNIVFTVDKYYLLQQYLTRGNPSFKFKSSIYKRNEPLYYMLTRSSSFDLTEENRFSISEPTKVLLENLDEEVYVEVYLEGGLPSGLRRLRNAIEETLEEFRIY